MWGVFITLAGVKYTLSGQFLCKYMFFMLASTLPISAWIIIFCGRSVLFSFVWLLLSDITITVCVNILAGWISSTCMCWIEGQQCAPYCFCSFVLVLAVRQCGLSWYGAAFVWSGACGAAYGFLWVTRCGFVYTNHGAVSASCPKGVYLGCCRCQNRRGIIWISANRKALLIYPYFVRQNTGQRI